MSATVQDVLKANVVFVGIELLDSQEGIAEFQNSIGSEVVPEGILIGGGASVTPTQGQVLRLPRDRIILHISSIKSVVEREYPTLSDLPRLAEITDCAIRNSKSSELTPDAFGFNIDLVCDQPSGDTALKYLADHLFSSNIQNTNRWTLVGGSGKFIFEEDGHRWTVTVEPRFGDDKTTRVYLGLNFHINDKRMPSQSEILGLLREAWDKAHNFLWPE